MRAWPSATAAYSLFVAKCDIDVRNKRIDLVIAQHVTPALKAVFFLDKGRLSRSENLTVTDMMGVCRRESGSPRVSFFGRPPVDANKHSPEKYVC